MIVYTIVDETFNKIRTSPHFCFDDCNQADGYCKQCCFPIPEKTARELASFMIDLTRYKTFRDKFAARCMDKNTIPSCESVNAQFNALCKKIPGFYTKRVVYIGGTSKFMFEEMFILQRTVNEVLVFIDLFKKSRPRMNHVEKLFCDEVIHRSSLAAHGTNIHYQIAKLFINSLRDIGVYIADHVLVNCIIMNNGRWSLDQFRTIIQLIASNNSFILGLRRQILENHNLITGPMGANIHNIKLSLPDPSVVCGALKNCHIMSDEQICATIYAVQVYVGIKLQWANWLLTLNPDVIGNLVRDNFNDALPLIILDKLSYFVSTDPDFIATGVKRDIEKQ